MLVVAFAVPSISLAAQASMAISPKDGTYVAGNEFTVGVILDTGGVSVNAVEGKIRYLNDDLSVVRIEKERSPITSWTTEPDYKTEEGLILFGGVHADGISGKAKTLFTVTFKAKRSGEARVRITSGAAILAEGGAGTNILTDLRGGTYTVLGDKERVEALRGGPSLLRSSSHPDEMAWYQDPQVSFEWSRSPNTDELRFSVDQNPEGSPTATLSGDTEGKNVTVEEGVWYGHLSLHDDSGWSPIGHLRVQIDTSRPETLNVQELPRNDSTDPNITLSLDASDAKSGISHYEIGIDGGVPVRWEDDGNHRYILPLLPPGEHVVLVRVFDRAGNSITETLVVSVTGLETPVVEPVPSSMFVGGEIDLEGNVSDGMTARISIAFDGGESRTEDVVSGPGGKFIHTFVFPQKGVYRMKVQAIDQRGATSLWTPEFLVRVEERSFLGAIGAIGSGGGILASLVFLAAGLVIGMWYGKTLGGGAPSLVAQGVAGRGGAGSVSSMIASTGRIVGILGKSLNGVRSRVFRKKDIADVQTTEPSEYSAPLRNTMKERIQPRASSVSTEVHTVSLRGRSKEVPPHGPTVLGR